MGIAKVAAKIALGALILSGLLTVISMSLRLPSEELVFVSTRDDLSGEIYVMDVGRRLVSRLTYNTQQEFSPIWSPDGTKIAFASTSVFDRDGNVCACVFAMNADGREIHRLFTLPSIGFDTALSWSHDGGRIAFTASDEVGRGIYIANIDGSNMERVNLPARNSAAPAWSPNDQFLAISSSPQPNQEVYVITLADESIERITFHPLLDTSPAWSPDGQWLAFSSDREENSEIYKVRLDGSGLTRLTFNPAIDLEPTWSPDGTRIAFTSSRDANREIYLMDADGRNVQRLTAHIAADTRPSWRP